MKINAHSNYGTLTCGDISEEYEFFLTLFQIPISDEIISKEIDCREGYNLTNTVENRIDTFISLLDDVHVGLTKKEIEWKGKKYILCRFGKYDYRIFWLIGWYKFLWKTVENKDTLYVDRIPTFSSNHEAVFGQIKKKKLVASPEVLEKLEI